MNGGPGASGIKKSFRQKKKEIKRRNDFSVKIIFSSISMSTFSDWMDEKFVNTKGAYTTEYPVTNLAWSQPKGPGYTTNCDETIFVDCSSNLAEHFEEGDVSEYDLMSYISFSISRFRDILYRRSLEGQYGMVHCTILCYHPCQKCLFALSELFGNSLEYSGVYGSFVSDVVSQDEYRYALRWIQNYGWKIQVDYCGVFDPYKAIGRDRKGDGERAKEMAGILGGMPRAYEFRSVVVDMNGGEITEDTAGYYHACNSWAAADPDKRKYEDGIFKVKYEGKWLTEEELTEKRRKIVDPTPEEMTQNLEKMRKAQQEKESKASRRKRTITKAMEDNAEMRAVRGDMEDEEVNYLIQHSDKYNDYGASAQDLARERARSALEYRKLANNHGVPIDGHYVSEDELNAEKKKIDDDVKAGQQQIEEYEKAIAAKKEAIFSQRVLCFQILVALGSIAFPPLAILDIAISVCEWVRNSDSLDAGDHALNAAGVAFDIIGLIPYFGKVFKMGKYFEEVGKTSGEIADLAKTAGFFNFDEAKMATYLKDVPQSGNDLGRMARANRLNDLNAANQDIIDWNRAAQAAEKADDIALQDIIDWNRAAQAAEKADDIALSSRLQTVTQPGLPPVAMKENLAEIAAREAALPKKAYPNLPAVKGAGPTPLYYVPIEFSGTPILDMAKEFVMTLPYYTKTSLKSLFLTGGSDVLSFFESTAITFASNMWLYCYCIGWNGITWVKGLNTEGQGMMPDEEQKRLQQQKVNAMLEYDEASKALAEANRALAEASTPEEMNKAREDIAKAEKRIEGVGMYMDTQDVHLAESANSPSQQIDAEAELKKAQSDERRAKRHLAKAKTPEQKQTAQKELEDAQKRKGLSLDLIDKQSMRDSWSDIGVDTSSGDDAYNNWVAANNNMESHNSQATTAAYGPGQIAALDGLTAGMNPLDTMFISENLRNTNNYVNSAQLNMQLGQGNSGYDIEGDILAAKEQEAFQTAQEENFDAYLSWQADIDADNAAIDLQWQLNQSNQNKNNNNKKK